MVEVQMCLQCSQVDCLGRVGHRILFGSERSVLFRSFKERNVLFRSFIEFLTTYETQKCKNVKEREERNVLLQRT